MFYSLFFGKHFGIFREEEDRYVTTIFFFPEDQALLLPHTLPNI